MEARDFETIEQFLKLVEKGDLFEYYGLGPDVPDDMIEEAIKKRRNWAQGQQSNPKFRNEALWIIKNMALIRRAVLEERITYQEAVQKKGIERALEKLSVYIEGTLLDGVLNPAKEAAILEQAQKLGVPAERALERAVAILSGRGGARASEPSPQMESFVDYYQVLRVPADADSSAIEEAHRARYREARDLADKGRASELYAQLDEGWRVLKDAERRTAYDARRREYMLALERRAAGEDGEFKGFLPPPPKKRRIEAESEPEHEPVEVVLTQAARVVHEAPPPARASQPPRSAPTPPRPAPQPEARPVAPPPPTVPQSAPPAPVVAAPHVAPVAAQSAQTSSNTSSTPVPTPPLRAPENTDAMRANSSVSGRQRQRAPQLEIDGPDLHKLKVANDPVAVQFVVRNAGQGQMNGRVLSDREWVQVTPARLDPNRREQVVEAVVHPAQMPRRQAISLVTVVADHGERRSITIDVEKRGVPVVVVLAIIAVALAFLIALVLAFTL